MTMIQDNDNNAMQPHIDPDISHDVVESILNKLDQRAIIVTDDGSIIFPNKAFLDEYALDFDKALGHKLYDPEIGIFDRAKFFELVKQTNDNGGSLKFERTHKSGNDEIYSEVLIIAIAASNNATHYLYLSKDITELRRSQRRAAELNEMLNKIIDNLPVYLFVKDVDDDFRYLIWNNAFAERSKIPAEKVIGRTDFEIFPEYIDAMQFRNDDLHVLEKGEMTMKQESYMAADGTSRIVQTFKTIVHRQDKGPLLVGISLDVTDIQGIEEELVTQRLRAEESDRLKTRFLANMSHEIRTPLNAIVGFAGMLPDTEDDALRRQFIEIIEENSELLLQLINDILDLSKIESGMIEYTRMPMDLYETMRNLYIVHAGKLRPGVKLFFDNESAPCKFIVNEDRNRLIQVLDNLLGNATKFTNKGEIHYGFTVEDDAIRVYVSDTGIGIPEDKREEIFERFVKLNNFAQGTGLGLPICRLIVETLGGTISVQSKEGEGSTFSFTIPYISDRCINATYHNALFSGVNGHIDDVRLDRSILVAEDISSNFLVTKAMIKGRYNVLWAKDGKEAVEMTRTSDPDLILMDLKMPGMDGLEAAREIRKFNPKVPIVALTANAFDDDRRQAREAGMNNFLSKPLNRDAFEAIINAYLGHN